MSMEAHTAVYGTCSYLCVHSDTRSFMHIQNERATEGLESARWPQTFQIQGPHLYFFAFRMVPEPEMQFPL